MPFSVIIVAAGTSARMGFDKLAAPLAGKPVLQHALDVFLALPAVREIIVVCPPERFALLDTTRAAIPVRRTDGGTDRRHSVAAGLATLAPDAEFIAVHDGARPLVHPDDVNRCLEAAADCGAAALARRVTETLKRSDHSGFCTTSVSRDNLWLMETPQIFAAPLLRRTYAALPQDTSVTDEVSAIQATGRPVRFVESLHPNPKITRPADLPLAAAILAAR